VSDIDNMALAYSSIDKLHVDHSTNTLFIAGTSRGQDVVDDLMLPFTALGGGVRHTTKHAEAMRVMDAQALAGDRIQRVVGHSLGGSVALAISEDSGIPHEVWGMPGWRSEPDPNAHRQAGDLISVFDRGAVTHAPVTLNPHSYKFDKGVKKQNLKKVIQKQKSEPAWMDLAGSSNDPPEFVQARRDLKRQASVGVDSLEKMLGKSMERPWAPMRFE
jgi:hypothetical protein